MAREADLERFAGDRAADVQALLDEQLADELTRRDALRFAAVVHDFGKPVTKGQTASSSYKPATLSNGVRTNVPPFIGAGTRIVVMTEDGAYVERAKE